MGDEEDRLSEFLPDVDEFLPELLGGDLNIETTPGKGTTFWFTLPFNEGEGYLKIVS